MATVKYSIRSAINPASIYCRYSNTRAIDIVTSTNLLINPKFWDHKNGKARNVIDIDSDELNKKLTLLRIHIFESHNQAYMDGNIIDRQWLQNTISEFFNRPKDEVKLNNSEHTIYYTDFADWWLKEKAPDWMVGPHKYLNDREISKHENFVLMVKEFQGKKRVRLLDVSNKLISDFAKHLNKNNYASSTIQRHVSRFKFFCLRAEELGFGVNKTFKQRVFVPEDVEIMEPYLDPKEIDDIFKCDFSDSETLDNVRDNLIIACWTGLRVSDFLSLDISNFIDDYIEMKTQKTKTPVVIPLHPMLKKILIKRNGQLPDKISDAKFNLYVKDVCKKAKINRKMKGKLFDKAKKRNVNGVYEKYKLVSSHIGRRSFATNLYGKISNSVIMGVCGWAKAEMMLHYIKKSNREHAIELKKYWEEHYN